MKKYFYYFFIIFLASVVTLTADDKKVLRAEDVKHVMGEILKQHVDQKDLSDKIIKSSFKIYIDQFDPSRVYLLESEVSPYLNPSEADLNKVMTEWKLGQFKVYERLNRVIEKAIERAQNERKSLNLNVGRLKSQLASVPDYQARLGFAKSISDLKERQMDYFVEFLKQRAEKFGNNTPQDQLVTLYENIMIAHENEYLMKGSKQDRDSLFYMHVLKGLTKSLDAHTSYLNNQEAFDMKVRLEKTVDGIGIVIGKGDDGYSVSKILKGSPAFENGKIKEGDALLKINGETINKIDTPQVMDKLRGKLGSEVTLTIKGDDRPLQNITLKRKTIMIDEGRVTYRYIPFEGGNIGVIKLTSFYQNDLGVSAEGDVRRAIEELSKKGPLKGLILDLRENSGGFLNQAVKVAGLFITNGVVVISKYSNGEQRFYRDMDGKVSFDGPLVILTSKLTASAAEIVAESLQDYGVALVVGDEQTYGKGTIQSQTVTDGDGSSYFKVTVGKYYTPSGKTPQEVGVKADIIVPSVLNGQDIGEEYLDSHLSNDHLESDFQDNLQDVDPAVRSWYLKYYMPTLQKKSTHWKGVLAGLRESSSERLKHMDYADKIHTENYGYNMKDDLQLRESLNIMKDMVLIDSKAGARGLTTQAIHN